MPTLLKTRKLFKANKIQNRIYVQAAFKNQKADDIEELLSEEAGITRKMLSHYLNNTSQPSIEQYCIFSQVLECSIDDLVELK